MKTNEGTYHGYRFPPEIIRQWVWLYYVSYETNRAEVSQQPTRQEERQMRRFKYAGQAQLFFVGSRAASSLGGYGGAGLRRIREGHAVRDGDRLRPTSRNLRIGLKGRPTAHPIDTRPAVVYGSIG